MTSISDVCGTVYGLVHCVGEALCLFDENTLVFEEARKLHRLLRGIEVFVSEIEPFLKGVRAWSSLRELEGTLTTVVQVLAEQSEKGPLVQYLQADRTLSRFAAAASRLDAALARLQTEAFGAPCAGCDSGACRSGGSDALTAGGTAAIAAGAAAAAGASQLGDEARRELCAVRGLLRSTRFELPPSHLTNLQRFRHACDNVQVHFATMLESYGGIMDDLMLARLLSKEAFAATIQELQQEVEAQQAAVQAAAERPAAGARSGGQPPEPGARGHPVKPPHQCTPRQQHPDRPVETQQQQQCEVEQQHLRMLMDVVRACHINTECEAPLEFICPLTHRLMQDPVLLHETGHSYERKALEEWWAKGHRFCPRTGIQLRRLSFSPNHNLRSAIERWHLHSDMHLSFRPVLNTLAAQQLQQERGEQQGHKQEAGQEQQLPGEEPFQHQQDEPCVQMSDGGRLGQRIRCLGSTTTAAAASLDAGQEAELRPVSCRAGSGDGLSCEELPGMGTAGPEDQGVGQVQPDANGGLQPGYMPSEHSQKSDSTPSALGFPESTEVGLDCASDSGCSQASGEGYARASSPALCTPQRSASKELTSVQSSPGLGRQGGGSLAEAVGQGLALKEAGLVGGL